MVRFLVAVLAGVLLAVGLVGATAAAPKEGKKHEVVSVECEGLGALNIITSENSASGFGPDGRVFVAKQFSEVVTGTITTEDGASFPFSDSFTEGAKGKGFEGRLIECTFEDQFTETFILGADEAEFLGVPEQYIGTEVTLTANTEGTALVVAPGR